MANEPHAPLRGDPSADAPPARRLTAVGAGVAAVAAVIGQAAASGLLASAADAAAIAAVNLGVAGMVVAGFGVARRPKDSSVLLTAAATAALASIATHPDWDSIRLLQLVMAVVAAVIAGLVSLPRTAQRVAVSLLVLYHFAGILTAITSPHPTPWMTAQLWARAFRPHLEFNYINNAYQFYSPQPGPANILWFCVYGDDGGSRWVKVPRRSELLDPLAVEYFRRLSLTERANQNVPFQVGPSPEAAHLRALVERDYPLVPGLLMAAQYRAPNEHARLILKGYARHVARTYGSGRPGVGVRSVKVYLTQHRMLSQKEFADNTDPYVRETYLPFFVGEFDPEGQLLQPYDPLLYWVVPILKLSNGEIRNYVIDHALSDPFEEK